MKLPKMKKHPESIPELNIHEALVQFEAQLIALSRRRKFTICRPEGAVYAQRTGEAISIAPPKGETKSR